MALIQTPNATVELNQIEFALQTTGASPSGLKLDRIWREWVAARGRPGMFLELDRILASIVTTRDSYLARVFGNPG